MKKNQKKIVSENTSSEFQQIIEDIVPVTNKDGEVTHIDIVLDDGTSFAVPNTKSTLLYFRNIMLEQTKEKKGTIKTKRRNVNAYKVMAIAGAAGFVLVNTTEFGQEIGRMAPSVLTGAVSLASGIGAMVNSKKLTRLQSNVTFACHSNEINDYVFENPYIYENISEKDKQLIEMWKDDCRYEPIVIENLDMLQPETISKIWRNINLYKQFGLQYKADGKVEEPGFQKVLLQSEEQSK